jgi:predicted nucleic acid-binding protein
LVFYELDDNLTTLAASLAYEEKITFYEAVYLALAKDLDALLFAVDFARCETVEELESWRGIGRSRYLEPYGN